MKKLLTLFVVTFLVSLTAACGGEIDSSDTDGPETAVRGTRCQLDGASDPAGFGASLTLSCADFSHTTPPYGLYFDTGVCNAGFDNAIQEPATCTIGSTCVLLSVLNHEPASLSQFGKCVQ